MRVALLVSVAVAAVLASSAKATPSLKLGITDSGNAYFASPQPFYSRLGQLHAKLLRVHLNWGGRLGVAVRRPENGFDPDDSAYDWRRYDAIVLNADEHGVHVVFSIFGSPRWANGNRLPTRAPFHAGVSRVLPFAPPGRSAGSSLPTEGA